MDMPISQIKSIFEDAVRAGLKAGLVKEHMEMCVIARNLDRSVFSQGLLGETPRSKMWSAASRTFRNQVYLCGALGSEEQVRIIKSCSTC